MTINEWKENWVKTVVDAGFSPNTALDTYKALYGRDGPDIEKCAESEAFALLGKLDTHQQH
ncbi:MAG: hypothetical protein Q7T66_06615 [Herminiimonas sp.]|uniref:hypothetical protein n=1 Tax=Herminiimonas sp. TaxID=1926289 RepID=UPI002726B74E|nr:hypothetical protein [Herminiimonas sp.]MDO9420316.1 hypothetical protein [Herminiimonas sp.]